jgi:alpha-2-macroglobulin
VATRTRQSELPRRFSAALLVALTALAAGAPARAGDDPSGYTPLAGEPFFLLSDKTYGGLDPAFVRLEVAGRGFGLAQVEEYGGVDVVLYRVPRPLPFLEKQKNLHRVNVQAVPAEEGLANALAYLWDRAYQSSRRMLRGLFSAESRQAVTAQAPELKMSPQWMAPTRFDHAPQFKPLPGFELVGRFRYPVHAAQPIQPPADVKLAGSSSEFVTPAEGNVMIPIGKLPPGLYLVEAYVGGYAAHTLVFVSDTVAVTKASASEMLVWAAERTRGAAVPGVEVAWTDGAGVLHSGTTDKQGLVRLTHEAPERSYVLGADAAGGVFISENFYYDSEIYDTKLYAVTDRPLYRPGDQVFVKFIGREFESARQSKPVAPGDVDLTVLDPGGAPVAKERLRLTPESGGDTSFRLPENCTAGGYELRFVYKDAPYSAAFRVAEYQKPHFEITLVPDKADFKAKEPVSGRLQLHYTDGKPVANADIQITVRSQKLTMVDGDLGYYGQFPVKLESEKLTSDGKGEAAFSLPAADEPSRYVITVMATDGAAFRVKTTKELLIERGPASFTLRADRQWSSPRDKVVFAIRAASGSGATPQAWEWVRLEDQQRQNGAVTSPDRLELTFADPGSYTVQLRDARGNVVGAASHWVSGGSVHAPTGSIQIVANKEKYASGETAELLVTFPAEVDEALLTLERDHVERSALMRAATGWVEAKRLAPTQWRVRVPVGTTFAPNITFSVAYVRDGDYVFQNQGLEVAQARVEVAFRPEKSAYAPGETVNVTVQTTVGGKPAAATLAVGVVDEMVYVLQPEIAPDIYDFFFHPRRNNVRTASSQSFISYDLAASRSKGAPEPHSVSERRVKVLERPRRDEVDTAFWQPSLRTDASGRGRFSFVMPDALTRWRITGRAFTSDGTVGQKTAYVRSEKDLYVKWTSPNWMRQGDAPTASIAVFNETGRAQAAELVVTGPGLARTESLTLKPGATYVAQPLGAMKEGGAISVSVKREGQTVDALETRFTSVPAGWRRARSLTVDLAGATTPLSLPPDARDVRVTFVSSSSAQFGRVIEDLLEYPYGCIEQTGSRMIPFALAIEALGPEQRRSADRLRQQLNGQRLRLAYLAGPKATFAWWGAFTTEDPFLTAYAYYADFIAVRALGLSVPADHWNKLLDVYRDSGAKLPFAQRALMLSFMQEMGLPVKTLADGFVEDLQKSDLIRKPILPGRASPMDSPLLGAPDGALGHAFALVLADRLVQKDGRALPDAFAQPLASAYEALGSSGSPAALALLAVTGHRPEGDPGAVLESASAESPTLERALALEWIRQSLGGPLSTTPSTTVLAAPWTGKATESGSIQWLWPPSTAVPTGLTVAEAPEKGVSAVVQFESAGEEKSSLAVGLERQLYKVNKADEGFAIEEMEPGEAFTTDALYLDDVTVTPGKSTLRYAVLEVPLPPGAGVESTTWGVELPGDGGKLEGLERARHEPTRFGYAVPVDGVSGPVHIRHLIRFAQRGAYSIPRARLYRMYTPGLTALEAGSAVKRLEVR